MDESSILKDPAFSFQLEQVSEGLVSILSDLAEIQTRLAAVLHCSSEFGLSHLVDTAIHRIRGYGMECYEVERALGIALGYPIGEEGGPCPGEPAIGDHTPTTLALEAAQRLADLTGVNLNPPTPPAIPPLKPGETPVEGFDY